MPRFDGDSETMHGLRPSCVIGHISDCYIRVWPDAESENVILSTDLLLSCEEEYTSYPLFSKVFDQINVCATDRDENMDLCERPSDHRLKGFACDTRENRCYRGKVRPQLRLRRQFRRRKLRDLPLWAVLVRKLRAAAVAH